MISEKERIYMEDFEKRFVSVFRLGLEWRWRDIRIESECVTGHEPFNCIDWNQPDAPVVIDPSRKYLIIKIYYPEDYKKEFPDWKYEYARPLTQAISHILYSLGLGCLNADATVRPKEGYYTFWMEMNSVVYARLPTLAGRGLSQLDAMPKNSEEPQK